MYMKGIYPFLPEEMWLHILGEYRTVYIPVRTIGFNQPKAVEEIQKHSETLRVNSVIPRSSSETRRI